MSPLAGSALCMMSASKPVPAMMMKPWRWTLPSSAFQNSSPMSAVLVRPSRQALASAAGSGALPMLLKNRFAVPEGKTSVWTWLSRMAVEHVGHGAVPAGDHDAVERAHVLCGLMRPHAVADEAQAYLIAGLGQSAREVENLV